MSGGKGRRRKRGEKRGRESEEVVAGFEGEVEGSGPSPAGSEENSGPDEGERKGCRVGEGSGGME